jgi:hypothetical protein
VKYRVVPWATGAIGKTCLRAVLDHQDMTLAGVYVYSPRKAGQDAGRHHWTAGAALSRDSTPVSRGWRHTIVKRPVIHMLARRLASEVAAAQTQERGR